MEIKWYGTATLAFFSEGHSILLDPFFPMNPELPSPALEDLAGLGDIFITHGHFDHLIDVPRVCTAGNSRVYCSEIAADSLLREGVERSRITVIHPGELLEAGPFTVRVFKGKHIKFNGALILKTLFNRRVAAYRHTLRAVLKDLRNYPEGQVLVFSIEAEDKKVMVLGSLNMDPSERYPPGADMLVLPFQGRSDLNQYTLPFIERLQPQRVCLHHFDDAFPPISSQVDVEPFLKIMKSSYPAITVTVPQYGETIEV